MDTGVVVMTVEAEGMVTVGVVAAAAGTIAEGDMTEAATAVATGAAVEESERAPRHSCSYEQFRFWEYQFAFYSRYKHLQNHRLLKSMKIQNQVLPYNEEVFLRADSTQSINQNSVLMCFFTSTRYEVSFFLHVKIVFTCTSSSPSLWTVLISFWMD